MRSTPRRGRTSRQAVTLAAVVGGAVTIVIAALPFTSFAYRSPGVHTAIETAATLTALLAGVLVLGRFLRQPTLPELVLAGGLLLLGVTNLFYSLIPALVDATPGSFDTWSPLAGRLLGAVALALAAILPATPVPRPRRALVQAIGGVVGVVVAMGLIGALLAPVLPTGIDPDLSPESSSRPRVVGEPVVLAVQLVAMLLYGAAAVGFTRKAQQTGDELMIWLAVGTTLLAFARLNYFLFPSIYSEWVYTGDFLRLAGYLVVLAGVFREIFGYQRELAEAAVHRERRRIARQLHDGLAQDLAFISGHARRFARSDDSELARHLARAAERALDESRLAITTLTRPVDTPLDASIAQAAEDVAYRAGVRVELDLAEGVEAPDSVHDALARIVREAVTNAVRHGDARAVAVRLRAVDGVSLTIEDDGSGLPAATTHGFGLLSMRERAEGLGGTLQVSPGRERGVRVEVQLP
jgi:signal transduction histidine kinase